MGSPQPTEDEKVAYFKLLGTLSGAAADHDDDLGEWEQRDRQQRRRFFKSSSPPEITDRASRSSPTFGKGQDGALKRVFSALDARQTPSAQVIANTQSGGAAARRGRLGALLDADAGSADETVVPDTTRPVHKALRRSDSTPMMPTKKLHMDLGEPSPSLGVGLRKRKRGSDPKLRPEAQQVFKDLAFFYIPDNDIAPARRLRIAKAREYGALWTRRLSTATHIVVDKNLDYTDVEKVIHAAAPSPFPRLVNEDYPIDCIQFRSLLDPDQKKYRVTGQPEATGRAKPEVAATPSGRAESLQAKPKPDHRGLCSHASRPSTPLTEDVSFQRSAIDATPASAALQPLDHEKSHGLEQVPRDELSSLITMMQEFKDIPLDKDEDEDEDVHSDSGQSAAGSRVDDRLELETDEMGGLKAKEPRSRPGQKPGKFEDGFACHHASEREAGAGNPNARTIQVLQSMASYYDRINDQWRTTGYRKAISTLKRQDVKICTEEEAFRLPHIGHRIAQKIEEIVTTDRLRRLEYAEGEATDGALQLFLQIYGVGTKQARQWTSQGYRTLDDVVRQAKLTASQKIGIERYDDLAARIPRREVEALAAVVRQAAARVDPAVKIIIGGSYRRGADSSHDIDLIVTKSGTHEARELQPFLDSLVRQLEQDEFLVARLASSRAGHDGSMWHGCCVLPKMGVEEEEYRAVWRRIDFLLVPETETGGALIYFTGNDIFNRSMRLLARKRGMRLNQRGLYKNVLPRPHISRKGCVGELVEGRDERRIFELLGVRWREPHERWC